VIEVTVGDEHEIGLVDLGEVFLAGRVLRVGDPRIDEEDLASRRVDAECGVAEPGDLRARLGERRQRRLRRLRGLRGLVALDRLERLGSLGRDRPRARSGNDLRRLRGLLTADSKETGPDSDDATVNPVAQQLTPVLAIDKSNNAPAAPGGAKSGDTVTYTIDYTITDGPADSGVIKDVLPVGVTYVAGSATPSENDEFVFAGYDSGTRTLTWTAVQVSENDSVSYKVTVDAGAAGIPQPLKNNACIVATGAAQVCDISELFVAAAVAAETDNPAVPTAPRTDVLDANGSATPGISLGIALLIIGLLAFAVLFVTPMPASSKNRIRRR
jgi:uncharacterized repeat protein (TIGR01451 family)